MLPALPASPVRSCHVLTAAAMPLALLPLLALARADVSTVGVATRGFLAALIGCPLLAALLNSLCGRPAAYRRDAVLPAAAATLSVLAGSVALGGWALQWLWLSSLWTLGAASLGYAIGARATRQRQSASRVREVHGGDVGTGAPGTPAARGFSHARGGVLDP